jgi:hypothetical protein
VSKVSKVSGVACGFCCRCVENCRSFRCCDSVSDCFGLYDEGVGLSICKQAGCLCSKYNVWRGKMQGVLPPNPTRAAARARPYNIRWLSFIQSPQGGRCRLTHKSAKKGRYADIPSLKMRDAIQFENQKNELPFVSLMDQDPPVLELYDQPTGEMKLHDRNREREFSGHGRSTSVPRWPHPAGTRPSSHHIAQSSPRL